MDLELYWIEETEASTNWRDRSCQDSGRRTDERNQTRTDKRTNQNGRDEPEETLVLLLLGIDTVEKPLPFTVNFFFFFFGQLAQIGLA